MKAGRSMFRVPSSKLGSGTLNLEPKKVSDVNKRRNLIRSMLGAIVSVGLACLIWEAFARSGLFAPALAPSVVSIGSALGRMILSGAMFWHTFYTLYRVLFGFVLASVVGVFIGILMGRFPRVERFFLPLVSVLMPIPSLAWVPVGQCGDDRPGVLRRYISGDLQYLERGAFGQSALDSIGGGDGRR